MVDFSNDSLISRAPIEIINLIVIEHWYNWRMAWQQYIKHKTNNTILDISECRARLTTLFLTIDTLLKRKLKPEEYDLLFTVCCDLNKRPNDKEILDAYMIISNVLDTSGLIRLDIKPRIDRTRIEVSNKAEGY